MRIQTRPAGADDATIVALLGRLTFSETFGYLFAQHPDDLVRYLSETFGVAKMQNSLSDAENHYWLAFADDLPVGYAKLKYPSGHPLLAQPKIGQLQKIYVLRDFLAQGVGLPLLQAVRDHAVVLDIQTIWLTVLVGNERALRFYRKHGFEARGHDSFVIGAQTFDFNVLACQCARAS